jgi:hypothetical protein
MVVWVRGSRLTPNLDLSSVIPDSWVTAAFFGVPVCAALATFLGALAVLRIHIVGHGTSYVGYLAYVSLALGLLVACINVLGLCVFLFFYVECGHHC